MRLNEAIDAFLEELQRRNRASSTIDNYRSFLRSWVAFGRRRSLTDLDDYDQITLRKFQDSWSLKPSSARVRYNMLRTFFSFAVDMDWIDKSPMSKMTPPKVTQVPTMPLTRDEFQALALAAENLPRERA